MLPYDPNDDAPNDAVDRAFPLDQCAVIPRGYFFTSIGPHGMYAQPDALTYGPFGPQGFTTQPDVDPMMGFYA